MRLTLLGYPSKIGKNFSRKREQDSLAGRDVKQGNYGKQYQLQNLVLSCQGSNYVGIKITELEFRALAPRQSNANLNYVVQKDHLLEA